MTRRTADRIVPIAWCAALVWALLLSNDAVLAGGEATADGQPVLKRIAHLGGRWSSIVASDRLLYVATGSTVTVVDAAIYDRPEIVAASASAGDLIECLAINEDYL